MNRSKQGQKNQESSFALLCDNYACNSYVFQWGFRSGPAFASLLPNRLCGLCPLSCHVLTRISRIRKQCRRKQQNSFLLRGTTDDTTAGNLRRTARTEQQKHKQQTISTQQSLAGKFDRQFLWKDVFLLQTYDHIKTTVERFSVAIVPLLTPHPGSKVAKEALIYWVIVYWWPQPSGLTSRVWSGN